MKRHVYIKAAFVGVLAIVMAIAYYLYVHAQDSPNLLSNPSLEMPYLEHGAGEVKVAKDWVPFWKEGDPPHEENQGPTARPEYKPLPKSLDPRRVVDGDTAQAWFLTYAIMDGGIYQRVRVTPGEWCRCSVSLQAWCTNSGNPAVSDGEMYASLMIDPAGKTDAFESGVVDTTWQWVGPTHKRYYSREVRAESEYITFFIRTWNKWRLLHNDVYADAASCTCSPGTGVTPAPTYTPRPTYTPYPTPEPCPTCVPGGGCDYEAIRGIVREELDRTILGPR